MLFNGIKALHGHRATRFNKNYETSAITKLHKQHYYKISEYHRINNETMNLQLY